jgi:hypothetical protein
MNSEVAATDATASVSTSTTGPATVVDSNVVNEESSSNPIKPLQINDQCHVEWHGTNPSASSSRKDNESNDGSSKKGISSLSIINLPAIVVERRIARKRMKRRKGEDDTVSKNHHVKRQRNSFPNSTSSGNSGDIPSLDVATIKKEMYDTLPADALEYYVHYVDHDRYVC